MTAAHIVSLLLVVARATDARDAATLLAVEHVAPPCFAAGRFPLVRARISPPGTVVRARVLFSGTAGAVPHAVAMTAAGDRWDAALPSPTTQVEAVHYRIVAESRSGTVTESPAHVVLVRASCDGAPAAGAAPTAIEPPAGGPPAPPGFTEPEHIAGTSTAADTGRSRRAGVIGPGRGVAVVVGALALAAGLDTALADPVPTSTGQVTLLDLAPPNGATIRAGDTLRISVRIVPAVTATSSPEIDLMQGPDGPICFALVAPSFPSHQPGIAETETFTGVFQNLGGCSEITVGRVHLGHAVPGWPLESDGPGRFDLPIRYPIAR